MLRISRYFVGNGPRAVPRPFAPVQVIVPLSPAEPSEVLTSIAEINYIMG